MKPSKLFDEVQPGNIFAITQLYRDETVRELLCVRDSKKTDKFSIIAQRVLAPAGKLTTFVDEKEQKTVNTDETYQSFHIVRAERGYVLLCYDVDCDELKDWMREWKDQNRLERISEQVERTQKKYWTKDAHMNKEVALNVVQLAKEIDNERRVPGEDVLRG